MSKWLVKDSPSTAAPSTASPSWDDVASVEPVVTSKTVDPNACDDRCAADCQYGQLIVLAAAPDLDADDGARDAGRAAGAPVTRERASRYHNPDALHIVKEAARLVSNNNAPKRARKLLAAAAANEKLPPTPRARTDYENQAARSVEEYLWTFGGVTLVTSILNRLIDRPATRTILAYSSSIPASTAAYLSKDERARKRIILNVRSFLKHICPPRKRTTEDQHVIDSVLAAMVTSEKSMKEDKMGRAFARVLHVTRHMINRATKVRDLNISESPYTGWIRCKGKQYLNAVTDHDRALLTDHFHTDEVSVINNDVKGGTRQVIGVEDGKTLYDVHTNRQWVDSIRVSRFDSLTGRSRDVGGFRVSVDFDLALDDFEVEDIETFKRKLSACVVGAVGRPLQNYELTCIRLAVGNLNNTADIYVSNAMFPKISLRRAIHKSGFAGAGIKRTDFDAIVTIVGHGCTATSGELNDAYAAAQAASPDGLVTEALVRKHALPLLETNGCMISRADRVHRDLVLNLKLPSIEVGEYDYDATDVSIVAVPTGLSTDEPHAVWVQVERSTATEKRPRGIRGSTKLIKSCECLASSSQGRGFAFAQNASSWIRGSKFTADSTRIGSRTIDARMRQPAIAPGATGHAWTPTPPTGLCSRQRAKLLPP